MKEQEGQISVSVVKSNDCARQQCQEQNKIPLTPLSNYKFTRTPSSIMRPSSILKYSTGHKRSCSLGGGHQTSHTTEQGSLLTDQFCNSQNQEKTKSVSILTPSQEEKEEYDLWHQHDSTSTPSNINNNSKKCMKCGKSNQVTNKLCQHHHHHHNYNYNYTSGDTLSDSEFFPENCQAVDSSNCSNCPGDQYHCRIHRNNSDNATDRMSIYSTHMEKDFRYYFQHPYARLFVAYFIIFCNFLIFAEDPLSHSLMECSMPILGNVISFIGTKYPKEWQWCVVKVSLWVTAIFVGCIVGKYILHHILLRRVLRLKMFRDEQGTWMIMFLSVFISCYFFSIIYNIFLKSAHKRAHLYVINTYMGMTYANFMKVAACGTWLGDFFTAWMITDMMLQDNLYPGWASKLRAFWRHHSSVRIFVFWTGAMVIAALVISLIVSDKIDWDSIKQDFFETTELSRAFLASSILVMDLIIVMQDWDFPHFVCDLDIKLPGLLQASYTFKFFNKSLKFPDIEFHITGKWFNYGIIIAVMMLDLNMWKNQIIYYPPDYGQYTDPKYHKVFTVTDYDLLATGNKSLWDYNTRASTFTTSLNKTLIETDLVVNSRYLGYPAFVKGMAFLPCAAGFILFFTLIYQYGRFPPKTDVSAGGRLKKRSERDSSWRRERRDSRHGIISWPGITIYEDSNITQR